MAERKPQGGLDLNVARVEKSCKALSMPKSYRKPTQVGGRKNAKMNERTLLKELGKKVAVTSG